VQIGVLSYQGDVREHIFALRKLGVEAVPIKRPTQLQEVKGLIIPGGESTTIGKLMSEDGFFEPIRSLAEEGFPIYGTCAGLILLAKELVDSYDQPLLGLMDVRVKRNAYGRQRESFEEEIEISGFENPFRAVFIRAPRIEGWGEKVEVLATYQGKPVMARQENILVTSFHPELTDDLRIHKYFLKMVKES
jgi:5'-phosphate synthase pdxT subunit